MAHKIDSTTGRAAVYSLRESMWHGLGTVVDAPVSDPRVLELAGLDWTADLRPVWTSDMDGNPVVIPNRRGVVRSDTGAAIGCVGDTYEAFQFFRDVCDADAVIETAGALKDGAQVWAMAKIPSLHMAIGSDVSDGYLLITNRHDGAGSLRILPTIVRVVCNNTLSAALGQATKVKDMQNKDKEVAVRTTSEASRKNGMSRHPVASSGIRAIIAAWNMPQIAFISSPS